MTESIFAAYPVFRARPEGLEGIDREVGLKELDELLNDRRDHVEVRGVYSTVGFRADADLMFWCVAHSADDVQDLLAEFRRTTIGRGLEMSHVFLGVVRPAEFAPDHIPAFVQGKEPRRYLCVYPFVRTPEWYLLDPNERAVHLRSHGELGREYPDVVPNTTSAFGLGDYEWVLAFEADDLHRLVDLIRHLRGNESRRYVKLEVPFITGIRKDLAGVLSDLP